MGTVQFLGRTLCPMGDLDFELVVAVRPSGDFRYVRHPEGALGILEEEI